MDKNARKRRDFADPASILFTLNLDPHVATP